MLRTKSGKVLKAEGEDNIFVQAESVKGAKLYNQLKPFGNPNQLLSAIYLLMQLFLLLKVTLSIPSSTKH